MTKTVEHGRAKSAILDAVHEGEAGLYASGFIDKRRM
ncbi:transcriptional regulator, partial [Corallococcus exiguus]|nr:transcriptional regulator [Corallococcus exiguus]